MDSYNLELSSYPNVFEVDLVSTENVFALNYQEAQNGQDGADGQDGIDGVNGSDGITPLLSATGSAIIADSGNGWEELIDLAGLPFLPLSGGVIGGSLEVGGDYLSVGGNLEAYGTTSFYGQANLEGQTLEGDASAMNRILSDGRYPLRSEVSGLSTNWQNTFTTVSGLSSRWQNTSNTVQAQSASWNAKLPLSGGILTNRLSVSGTLSATGRIIAPIGTVTSPSYTFSSGVSSGFYEPSGAGSIGYTSNGVQKFRLDSGGFLILGTTADSDYFRAFDNSSVFYSVGINTAEQFFGYGQAATGGTAGFYRNAGNGLVEFRTQNFAAANLGVKLRNTSNRFYIADSSSNNLFAVLHSGNVGVGTITPNEKLTVVGNISATGGITANGSSQFNGSIFVADSTNSINLSAPAINLNASSTIFLNSTDFAYPIGGAAAHRTSLESGATGDEVFRAGTVSDVRNIVRTMITQTNDLSSTSTTFSDTDLILSLTGGVEYLIRGRFDMVAGTIGLGSKLQLATTTPISCVQASGCVIGNITSSSGVAGVNLLTTTRSDFFSNATTPTYKRVQFESRVMLESTGNISIKYGQVSANTPASVFKAGSWLTSELI